MTEATHGREAPIDQAPAARQRLARAMRGDAWTVGLIILFLALFAATKLLRPTYGLDALAVAALPVAFAAAGQAIAVISGGIDLSIGSVMALTNVVAAVLLVDASTELSVLVVLLVLVMGLVIGAVNGTLVVISRVPDIVVTLAMLFVWAGAALLVLGTPGGGSAPWIRELVTGNIGGLIPRGLILLLLLIGIIWIPLRRSRLGLSIYAIGSNQLAAFRSGVNVRGTKVAAYALTGFFAALGGLALTASTGIGTPIPGPYLLLSVAAIVLGGVSLAGGRGGLLGPIAGIYVLSLIRADLTFLGVEPAYSTVIQGAIMVAVVMAGAYLTLRRATA